MTLYKSTLRALLLNAVYLYKGKITKMHKNFVDLKTEVCNDKGIRPEISTIEYIRLLGTIFTERGESTYFYEIIRKHELLPQVYATKIFSWQQVKNQRCSLIGITNPCEYNYVLGDDNKYYSYEKL